MEDDAAHRASSLLCEDAKLRRRSALAVEGPGHDPPLGDPLGVGACMVPPLCRLVVCFECRECFFSLACTPSFTTRRSQNCFLLAGCSSLLPALVDQQVDEEAGRQHTEVVKLSRTGWLPQRVLARASSFGHRRTRDTTITLLSTWLQIFSVPLLAALVHCLVWGGGMGRHPTRRCSAMIVDDFDAV